MKKCRLLILGFFGTGKTTYVSRHSGESVFDLTVFRPSYSEFLAALAKYEVVMADPNWKTIFDKSGLPYTYVLPTTDRKQEILDIIAKRSKIKNGTCSGTFYYYLNRDWDRWMNDTEGAERIIRLEPGVFLEDVIDKL